MAFSYNINTSKADKTSSVCLFSCHAIMQIIGLFVNTFLVAQIYSYVDGVYSYIFNVCMFIGITYFFMGITSIPFGSLVDKTNRVWVYRMAIVLRTALVIVSIFCGKNISKMLLLAGLLNGVSNSLYYSAYNTLKQEMVSRKSMRGFAVTSQIASLFVSIVIPVVMGKLIDVSTYAMVSVYVLIICVIQIGLSFGVRSKKPEGSNYSLKGYFKKLKERPDVYKKMKAIYIGAFIYGFTTIVTNLLNICIMMEFGSNFGLGAITSIFSAVSIITILLYNKFTHRGKRSAIYILSAMLPFVCTVIFAIWPSVWALILFNLGTAVSGIIYQTTYDVYRNSILKEAGLYNEITEHQSLVETLLCVSRILSHGLVLLLSLLHSLILFKIILCVSVLSYSGVLIFLLVFEKKYLPKAEEINVSKQEKIENENATEVEKK